MTTTGDTYDIPIHLVLRITASVKECANEQALCAQTSGLRCPGSRPLRKIAATLDEASQHRMCGTTKMLMKETALKLLDSAKTVVALSLAGAIGSATAMSKRTLHNIKGRISISKARGDLIDASVGDITAGNQEQDAEDEAEDAACVDAKTILQSRKKAGATKPTETPVKRGASTAGPITPLKPGILPKPSVIDVTTDKHTVNVCEDRTKIPGEVVKTPIPPITRCDGGVCMTTEETK
ncbi:hypothetical protein UFOVP1299_26 [uncultured Caudovirales phage]|uniref:Uncharacterized protein n=1 Tax=uncultured Caudovirales phage TaxID=2100421 RepID=A0A6J5RN38_9CAUD|nr:hypothetical protein UFOVP1299_26 [uncultured Caudovirales phage]